MPFFRLLQTCLTILSLVLAASLALADATNPTKDIDGASDSQVIGRYDGSFIVSYDLQAYAALKIPLSPLRPSDTQGELDSHNNRVHVADKVKELEGKLTRLVYVAPEGRSPLEVLRNYQEDMQSSGGSIAFECKREQCGGDPTKTTSGGGGKLSLMQYFMDEASVKDAAFSNGECALTQRMDDQHFTAAHSADETTWVTVHTYKLNSGNYCKALNARTIAVVFVMEQKPREQKMVTVDAAEMARSIEKDGSISLYGIYFDTNKAELKPESEPTLVEIANLLKANMDMVVLVVGHTDNQGSVDYNLDLSQRRAKAVRDALIKTHGIKTDRLLSTGAGLAAPVASNRTEEGRALNRRVALVELNAKK